MQRSYCTKSQGKNSQRILRYNCHIYKQFYSLFSTFYFGPLDPGFRPKQRPERQFDREARVPRRDFLNAKFYPMGGNGGSPITVRHLRRTLGHRGRGTISAVRRSKISKFPKKTFAIAQHTVPRGSLDQGGVDPRGVCTMSSFELFPPSYSHVGGWE